MKTYSVLLALCAGNSPVTGEFPAQKPVTRSVNVFFDLRLNKRLSKQSWGWWFETPSRSLWCHCDVLEPLSKSMPIPWWRHQMETFFALLAIYAGNSPVTGEFPAQRPVTRSFAVFFDLRLNNGWVNNRDAGDFRRHRAHYDVIVMSITISVLSNGRPWHRGNFQNNFIDRNVLYFNSNCLTICW